MRNRLLTELEYASQMVKFIDHIIKCSIRPADTPAERLNLESPDATLRAEPDADFAQRLEDDSNAVVLKRQMHSVSHNATCFKYGAAATRKCRFDFPRPVRVDTKFTLW